MHFFGETDVIKGNDGYVDIYIFFRKFFLNYIILI